LTFYFKIIGSKKANKDVLFIESFTYDGAGYEYRVKHWQRILVQKGLKVESVVVIEDAKTFFQESKTENLPNFILKNIRIRIRQIIYSRQFKLVIVRRNMVIYNQYGDHFMEKFLLAAHQNCVLDFDDDLGAQEPIPENTFFNKIIQHTTHQFYNSFKYYNGFICGSNYLKDLLQSHRPSQNVVVIPTCVDYTNFSPKVYSTNKPDVITFGWIGGNHNLFLIDTIIPFMNELSKEIKIELLIIAGLESYDFNAEFPVIFEQYSLQTEKESLCKIDIGLMPLTNDAVSKGKCGFKLLQYMGLGIPGIASAITVNNEIIDDETNGWLVHNEGDWLHQLRKSVKNYSNLKGIGENAIQTVKSGININIK
jgi:glycosyltransferase involved in cell wall biosynthesis